MQSLPEYSDSTLVNESPLYFTRTRGLFRECFPGEKSDDPEKTSAPIGEGADGQKIGRTDEQKEGQKNSNVGQTEED